MKDQRDEQGHEFVADSQSEANDDRVQKDAEFEDGDGDDLGNAFGCGWVVGDVEGRVGGIGVIVTFG